MRMLVLLLASTSIVAAGCGDNRGTAYRGSAMTGDSSTAMGTSSTSTGTGMTTGRSMGSASASGTVPNVGTPGTTAGAMPPGGLASATILSSPDDVRIVQNRLRQFNFYGGEMSGYWNADTEMALRNFQRANGLPITRLDQNTLRVMGLEGTATGGGRLADITYLRPQPPVAQAAPPPPVASIAPAAGPSAGAGMIGRNLDQSSVRQVQQKLATEGFYRIPVDGIWGPVSQDALLQFQDSRNLQVSGRLTPETVSAMGLDQSSLRWKSGPAAMRR